MAKIVIDARELRTSSGRYVERLLHYLQKIDESNDYLVLLKPTDIDGWKPLNPNFKPVVCPHKEFSFAEQVGLKRQLDALSPDLVHFTFPQQPGLYGGKVITTFHDLTTLRFRNPAKNPAVFWFRQRVYSGLLKRVAHKSASLLVPSEFVKQDVADFAGVSPDKIIVTYEAADAITSKAEPFPNLEKQKFLLYVGRPFPHKNLSRLVEAFGLLGEQFKDTKLVLAGKKDANYSALEAATKNDRVVFTGRVSEGELRWLYENCSAYAFPSLSEGFSLSGLEAMVHGAPLVSSNATCLPEIYGPAAHYFDPTSTMAMVQAIEEVLGNQELRKKLVAAGYAQAKQYSWQTMAKQTLDAYKKVLED